MLHAKFWAIAAICLTIASPASAQLYDRGTMRDGALISEQASPSATACRASCALDNSCAAWTWERPGEQGPEAMCRLQAEAVTAKPDNCCISGVSPASNPDGARQVAALDVGAVEARHTVERADGGRDGAMRMPSRQHAPFTRKLTRYAPSPEPAQPAIEMASTAATLDAEPQIGESPVAPAQELAAVESAEDIDVTAEAAPRAKSAETEMAALESAPTEPAAPEAKLSPVEPVAAEDEGPVLLAADTPAPSLTAPGPDAAFKAAPTRPEPVEDAPSEPAFIPAPEPVDALPASAELATTGEADRMEIAASSRETSAGEPAEAAIAQAALTPAPEPEPAVEPTPAPEPAAVSEPAPAAGPVRGARLLPDSVRPEPNPMISTADKRRAGEIALGELVALNFDPTANDNDASEKADETDEESEVSGETAEDADKSEDDAETAELVQSGGAEAQDATRQGYVHPSQRSPHPRYSVQHEYAAPYAGPAAS